MVRDARFERDESTGSEAFPRAAQDFFEVGEPVVLGDERGKRLAFAHFRLGALPFRAREVGRVGDDRVERSRDVFEPVAPQKFDVGGNAFLLEICLLYTSPSPRD